MFGNDRTQIRRIFTDSWKKHLDRQPLEPLEQLLVQVIELHPEYHGLLENPDSALDQDYLPEGGKINPFLHLGMHISLQEQLQTNRPVGIVELYRKLTSQTGDAHSAEHQLMECLGKMIWEAQRANQAPDENAYLDCIKKLIRKN